MFVLGIDPGLTRCGFGLVEVPSPASSPFARFAPEWSRPTRKRPSRSVGQLLVELRKLMEETRPDAVVVERVFYQRNAKTAIRSPRRAGSRWPWPERSRCPCASSRPAGQAGGEGYGAASKNQVQGMVARLCGLVEIPRPADAADALALAISTS